MSRRAESNEVVIHRRDAGGIEVVEVSQETLRWSRRDSGPGPELRTIRRPFTATIEKVPNLCGPVLRIAATADDVRARARERRTSG